MTKNYLTYPCRTMRITQNYNGTTSHKPHTTGRPKDYPWDEGCEDSGRSYCYCPCGEMKVMRIYGVGTRGTNTIWLESTSKVVFADGTSDYFTMLITHPNDDDLKKIKVGQKFQFREKICSEGKDGATGNHFHFSAGKGKFNGNGWTPNTNGKYVLTTTAGQFKPEQLFYIDETFTKIVNSKGLNFKTLPKEKEKEEPKNDFLPARGYFKKGDKGENVKKINDFYYNVFPTYEDILGRDKENVLGNLFGENTKAWTEEFQRRTGLKVTGRFGKKTLAKAVELGFEY